MTTQEQMKRRAILVFMLNRPGVLNKISMLIRRKMYNVDTLTVCATHRPGISRMTLTLREDDDDRTIQVIRQIEKITEVISARELDVDQSFWREVAVLKFESNDSQLEYLQGKYHFDILDRQNHELYIVQLAGTSKMIDDFMKDLGKENIVETARSGFTAMEK
jgi:acetolactate synthase-1/3 small subunit